MGKFSINEKINFESSTQKKRGGERREFFHIYQPTEVLESHGKTH